MSDPKEFIMTSIKNARTNYNQPKPTWNQYVKQNYSNVAKIPNQHPMTTLSNQYKNLQR